MREVLRATFKCNVWDRKKEKKRIPMISQVSCVLDDRFVNEEERKIKQTLKTDIIVTFGVMLI